MAEIGWIDFSPADRNRVGSVLDLLRPEGVVDELGLGMIRDSTSDKLFPGISTIQTRAKYFFIVPYILRDYQLLQPTQKSKKSAAKFLEDREYEVMWQLAENYNYQEGQGIIGITKRKPEKIIRRPSAIYWTGLYTYKFIDTRGLSMDYYLNIINKPNAESMLSIISQVGDEGRDDLDAEYEDVFGIKVPYKLNWANNLSIELDKDEAEFFQDRVTSIAKGKLVSELLTNDKLWSIFKASESYMVFAKAAIKLQETGEITLTNNLRFILILAHDYSELMHGAHIAYNCQLHHKFFNSNYFDQNWNNWLQNIEFNMIDYDHFNPDQLFEDTSNLRPYTMQFITEWWRKVQLNFPDMDKRDEMIKTQEAYVKGSKARIRWSRDDDVRQEQWLGLGYFDYRFNQAKTILNDIRTGLKN